MQTTLTKLNTKIGHYRTTWSRAWVPSRKQYDSEIVTFSGLQQTADFSSFVTKDVVWNPNWKTLVSQGRDASNTYSTSGFIRLKPAYFYGEDFHVSSLNRGRVRIVGTAGAGVVSLPDDNVVKDIALKRVKDKLNDKVANAKALVPLGELREMRSQIAEMAGLSIRFVNLWREIVHGKFRTHHFGLRELPRQASDAWLTYSFGIKPMISDVQALSRAITEHLLKDDLGVARLTGTASSEERQSSNPTVTGTANANVNFNKATVATLSYRYVLGVDLRVFAGNNYGIMERLGFETKNIPSLGWELFPFSWILDYFTTAGDYFDDTFVIPPGSTKYLVLCTRRTSRTVLTPYFVKTPNIVISTMTMKRGLYEYFEFSRQKLTTLPHRAFRLKSVDEIGKGAVNKLLNLSSLVGSGIKDRS